MEEQENIIDEPQTSPSATGDVSSIPNGTSIEEEDELLLMEQFMSNPEHDYHHFRYGDTVDGIIMRIDKDSILVDIGTKSEGIVPAREMQSLAPEDRAKIQVGDELLVFVLQAEDRDGQAILSIDKARLEKVWRTLQLAHEHGEIMNARVVNYNKGGLLVNLDGVRGFVPASQVSGISRGPDSQKQSDMARMVGHDLRLKVIEINRSRNRLILSERQAEQEMREVKKDELLLGLQEGDIRTGVVSSVCDFGVFVDIGGADGLVHLSEISWGRVKHPGEILKVGEKVQVSILSIDNERKRIALSIKRTQAEPWTTVNERYQLGQIVEAKITQLVPFGAFASLEEGIEGLIHVSELGDGSAQHPRDILKEDDSVQVRIIRIDPERKRMGLSLRLTPDEEQEDSSTPPDSDDTESSS